MRAFGLQAACVALLPPCFKHGNGKGIGKIHAAVVRQHGEADFLLFGQCVQNFGGQSARFGPEQKYVARLKRGFIRTGAALGGERKDASAR